MVDLKLCHTFHLNLQDSCFLFLFFLSMLFQIFLAIYKRIRLRKVYNQQQIYKQLLVQNFLNLYGLFWIILSTISILSFVIYHFQAVEKNKHIQDEEELANVTPNKLIVLVVIESMLQAFPFIQNYALRAYTIKKSKEIILLILPLSLKARQNKMNVLPKNKVSIITRHKKAKTIDTDF